MGSYWSAGRARQASSTWSGLPARGHTHTAHMWSPVCWHCWHGLSSIYSSTIHLNIISTLCSTIDSTGTYYIFTLFPAALRGPAGMRGRLTCPVRARPRRPATTTSMAGSRPDRPRCEKRHHDGYLRLQVCAECVSFDHSATFGSVAKS